MPQFCCARRYRGPVTTTPAPATVGGYRLLACIGAGGMGIVHLAESPTGQRVALKVLRPHVIGDQEARERLAQEVASLRRVNSPRIAGILDADPHGPLPYVVTRYIPGLSLNRHLEEEGPIEGADLVHFGDGLAEALMAVHDVGVLHRDVKPTNVLLEGRSPVLIDFGLARAAEDPQLTVTGFMVGTPGYLPPEVVAGDAASAAGDVHAWAATVAYAATGRPPYGRGHTMAIMERVRRGEHDLDGLDGPIADLLIEALAIDPLHRPTIREVRGSLRELGALPDLAPPQTTHLSGHEPMDEPEFVDPWTMPVRPLGAVQAAAPVTTPLTDQAPQARIRHIPADRPTDVLGQPIDTPRPTLVAPPAVIPAAPAAPPGPAQQLQPRPPVSPMAADHGRVLVQPDPSMLPPTRAEKTWRSGQRLALGFMLVVAFASAPALVGSAVAMVVLSLRTASLTRQRHQRRQSLRGRARWYDVPTTTLSLPGYLLMAAAGTALLVTFAAVMAACVALIAHVAGRNDDTALLLGGMAAVPSLWWGPGSSRVREMVDPVIRHSARSTRDAALVVALGVVVALALLTLLGVNGPNWEPLSGAPWG